MPLLPFSSAPPSGTTGSVLFYGSNGSIAEDNANFYWDDTNNKLSIGTTTANGRLTVLQTSTYTRTSGINLMTNDTFRNVGLYWDANNNATIDTSTPNASLVFNPTGGLIGIGNVVPTATIHIVTGNNKKAQIYAVGGAASTDWAQLLFGEDLTSNYGEIIRYSNASTLNGRFDVINRTSSHILSIGATDTLSYLYGSAGATLLIGMGTQSPAATVHIKGGDNQVHHIVQANSTQTANVANWIDSSNNVYVAINGNFSLLIGQFAKTLASWGTSGVQMQTGAITYTDSSAAGTRANGVANSFATPTFAASNAATTITDAATTYIAGAPAAGTNMTLTRSWSLWIDSGHARFDGNLDFAQADATNLVLGTTTGTKFGTGTTQKLSFYNSTPIVQPAGTGETAGFTANASTNNVFNESTFTGNVGTTAYTISDIVKALKNLGLMAA